MELLPIKPQNHKPQQEKEEQQEKEHRGASIHQPFLLPDAAHNKLVSALADGRRDTRPITGTLSVQRQTESTRHWACACEVYGTGCLLYTSPSPRDGLLSRMPSSA